jgi:hypothetical protein
VFKAFSLFHARNQRTVEKQASNFSTIISSSSAFIQWSFSHPLGITFFNQFGSGLFGL